MELINLSVLIISIIALIIAISSWVVSQRAYSLSLFNNRFKLYYKLNNLLLELFQEPILRNRLRACENIELLILESTYLFGDEIRKNIIKIYNQVNPGGDAEERINDADLKKILRELLCKDKNVNLDSHFSKYLYHASFKKPIGWKAIL